jgi:hypothetical protein
MARYQVGLTKVRVRAGGGGSVSRRLCPPMQSFFGARSFNSGALGASSPAIRVGGRRAEGGRKARQKRRRGRSRVGRDGSRNIYAPVMVRLSVRRGRKEWRARVGVARARRGASRKATPTLFSTHLLDTKKAPEATLQLHGETPYIAVQHESANGRRFPRGRNAAYWRLQGPEPAASRPL